ncbi:hypothetical protein FisN_25Hu172 [Fistulifera solaris]|jgi:hypothetical protein|uniref:Uncharacterized protein n=1 Tax=Fistulifera solaris TaxID=1519565 RepID=A0A1Z5JWI4_FISSO|nr:hypothetical protein FisN_25Hu172 [Fistulifera solaris]|eukprot:GAX18188.1 hypothetical protein FisN_25Hu172 [Fistulifera solaris]
MNPDQSHSERVLLSTDSNEGKCVSSPERRMDLAGTVWAEEDANVSSVEASPPEQSSKLIRRERAQSIPDMTGYLTNPDSSSPRRKKVLRSPRLTKAAYKTILKNKTLGSLDDDSTDAEKDLTVFMSQHSDALNLGDDDENDAITSALEKSLSTLVTVDENHSITEHDVSNGSILLGDEPVSQAPKNRRSRHSTDPATVWINGSSLSKPHLELNVALLMNGCVGLNDETPSAQSKPIFRARRRQVRKKRELAQMAKEANRESRVGKDPDGAQSAVVTPVKDAMTNLNEELEGSMSSLSESPMMAERRRTRHASAQEFWSYLEDKEKGHQSFPQPSRSKQMGRLQHIRGLVTMQKVYKSRETADDVFQTSVSSLTSPMGPRLTLQNIELIKEMSTKKDYFEEIP